MHNNENFLLIEKLAYIELNEPGKVKSLKQTRIFEYRS